MNLHISGDSESPDEITLIDDMADDLSDEETSQVVSRGKQFNISARRRVEEYLENKRLASLTMDSYYSD